ncbi:unnamed protein product, partial [Bubo scandiacus]
GEDSQAAGVSEEEEGQEEGRRKKHLTRQILLAPSFCLLSAPGAAWEEERQGGKAGGREAVVPASRALVQPGQDWQCFDLGQRPGSRAGASAPSSG